MCPLLNEPIGGADSRPDGQIRGAESPWICGTKVAGRNQGPWRRSAPARPKRHVHHVREAVGSGAERAHEMMRETRELTWAVPEG